MKDILTLGIESSCDETSVSVVKNGSEVLSNVINSQIDIVFLKHFLTPFFLMQTPPLNL